MQHAHIYSLGAYLTNAYTTKKLLLTQTSVEKKQKYYLCITSPKEFVKIYVPLWYINTCNKFYWYRSTHIYLYIIYIKHNEQSEKTFCGVTLCSS